jgi:hypothetical protein
MVDTSVAVAMPSITAKRMTKGSAMAGKAMTKAEIGVALLISCGSMLHRAGIAHVLSSDRAVHTEP